MRVWLRSAALAVLAQDHRGPDLALGEVVRPVRFRAVQEGEQGVLVLPEPLRQALRHLRELDPLAGRLRSFARRSAQIHLVELAQQMRQAALVIAPTLQQHRVVRRPEVADQHALALQRPSSPAAASGSGVLLRRSSPRVTGVHGRVSRDACVKGEAQAGRCSGHQPGSATRGDGIGRRVNLVGCLGAPPCVIACMTSLLPFEAAALTAYVSALLSCTAGARAGCASGCW